MGVRQGTGEEVMTVSQGEKMVTGTKGEAEKWGEVERF